MKLPDEINYSLPSNLTVLEALHNVVDGFYNNESTQRKISLISIHPSTDARKIEDDLLIIDDLIGSIERNTSCGNLKRAFHFLLLLKKKVDDTHMKIQAIDYFELLVTSQ